MGYEITHWIDGREVAGAGSTQPIMNPATGGEVGTLQLGDPARVHAHTGLPVLADLRAAAALAPDDAGLRVALGAALMIAAAWTMTRRGATLHPGRPPTALVTHGVYARSRNPIYLADAIILAGLCLIRQPLGALVSQVRDVARR